MDIANMPYNPTMEKIVNILMTKTQNYDPSFFRLQTNFFLGLVPSVMGITIDSPLTGKIPINSYAVSLNASGTGKGFSTNILEEHVIGAFKNIYMTNVFPKKAELSLEIEAVARAQQQNISNEDSLAKLQKEFRLAGSYKFTFDSATTPAIKQLRNKILLAKSGAINIIIDEAGFNLSSMVEPLTAFLELYDKGLIREKLTKNTTDSTRFDELTGSTPANLLMFGTPSKLLDGAKTEDQFFELLEAGYARRAFFSMGTHLKSTHALTPEQQYDLLTQNAHMTELITISNKLARLANTRLIGSTLELPKDVAIELLQYRNRCEEIAQTLPEHEEVLKAEIKHRYFKVLKLAGVYAFIDGNTAIQTEHIHQAIKFAEDSGNALKKMFTREKPYEKLAKFIADNKGAELTLVDIQTSLPWFKGTISQKDDLLSMATAWGYKNNIIIKRSFADGIEFITGESLDETDLDQMIVAYSQQWSDGYVNATNNQRLYAPVAPISWKNIDKLVTATDYHWTNHYSKTGRRTSDDMEQGFNMVVLDIDHKTSIATVQKLMGDYTYLIHTTKRHQTEGEDRFRLLLPTNYELSLNATEYKQFMQNIAKWLPFDGLDEATFQPSRKWACHDSATIFRNDNKLLDITPFIPRTKRNEEFQKTQLSLQSLTNLERWFALQMQTGNRNNVLARFGFFLLDTGLPVNEIQTRLLDFNSRLENGLDEAEILTTVMKTINNRSNN